MRENEKSYAAVLPNGSTYFAKSTTPLYVCETAVNASDYITSRANPQTIDVELFVLEIANGQQTRRKIQTHKIRPPYARMTEEEFTTFQNELVNDLPEEFRSYVTRAAWERGHSAGYEEIINIATEIVSDIIPHIQKYTNRILKQ